MPRSRGGARGGAAPPAGAQPVVNLANGLDGATPRRRGVSSFSEYDAIRYHVAVLPPCRTTVQAARVVLDTLKHQIEAALGQYEADLCLVGGRVVNVFSGDIEPATVTVHAGRIVGVGPARPARHTIDVNGAYLAPAFIDGHMHLESSQLWLDEFAGAVVPRGTGVVVADPHEIANVLGFEGVTALRRAAAGLPLSVFFAAPSCVPASSRERGGARLDAGATAAALATGEYIGLGEVMDFPGVLAGDRDMLAKIGAAEERLLPVDGHAPGLRGPALDGYALAGVGADHESTTLDEAREKLARGLVVMIRDGSTARNLEALLPLVTPATAHRCAFVSDDRDASTLLHEGHLDAILRAAVRGGLDPVIAIRLVTLNPALFWRLNRLGAVAPGYYADLVVLEDLREFRAAMTLHRGQVVARGGLPVTPVAIEPPDLLRGTIHTAPFTAASFRASCPGEETAVIGIVPGQIVTNRLRVTLPCSGAQAIADSERDLAKLVVMERHRASGNIGVGFVHGFGLTRGALVSSVAHDAHNLIGVGIDDADLELAFRTVVELDGGLAVADAGKVLAVVPLPLAGLVSDRPAREVVAGNARLEAAARGLGCRVPSPFALLSFLSLSVIPAVRVTDRGVIEVG